MWHRIWEGGFARRSFPSEVYPATTVAHSFARRRGVTRTPVGDLDPNPKNISYPKFSGRLVKGGGRPVYPGVTVADEVRDGA